MHAKNTHFSINNLAGAKAPALKTSNIMKEKKEEKERQRKAYAAKGERSQRTMTFRLDNELAAWLNQQPNKGRYINELIKSDQYKHSKEPG